MELNKANREVCDVDIRTYADKKPFLNFNTANTTTAGLNAENVYAMAKGTRRIAFPNPITGTMTIEAQVYPFKLFSLFSDGVIDTTAAFADKQTIKAEGDGKLTIADAAGGVIQEGTVFVYPKGEWGEDGKAIVGTFSGGTFTETASEPKLIKTGSEYEVGYVVSRSSGVKKVSFNGKKMPKDYFITQKTVDKDEKGNLVPFIMTAYKASVQRNFELSFASEGDPASVKVTFDLMEDDNNDVFDMIEITDEENA